MKIDFTGKTVLVTGASGGIGRAISLAFSRKNATIHAHYKSNKKKAEKTLQLLSGDNHSLHQADLSNHKDVEAMINNIGDINIVVNNAAVVQQHEFDSLEYEDWGKIWEETIGANLMGPAYLMFLTSKNMQKNDGGKFINISSRGAFRGEPKAAAYGASKAGLNALGQSMAQALAKDNIFVYTLAPGFVETERVKNLIDDEVKAQSPLNRVAKPEEVAQTAIWLASDGNDFLTGSIIDINGASYLRS
ncbi:MAG: SDR family oxidoreductase [Candidatus Marinimicrobia bacterium]|jgi:NAD(P)-dependent dehydrogenase (short-subunit alcohol dehydrogenase family)|nr:SDR family oxidoreductase [Candidatus Neomarinimicrobiota bacterium]|tara:strand:+ start:1704 stop:2444 length:741 start_codon:yes stop_codon:yes gene_type:complete